MVALLPLARRTVGLLPLARHTVALLPLARRTVALLPRARRTVALLPLAPLAVAFVTTALLAAAHQPPADPATAWLPARPFHALGAPYTVAHAQADAAVIHLPLALDGAALSDLPAPNPATATDAPPPTDTPEPTTVATEIPTQAPSPTATGEPTATDEPTVTPTPEPTAAPLRCEEHVPNWDFEAGPRQWTLVVTSSEQRVGLSIQHRSRVSVPPYSGDYLAWLGALPSTIFSLTSDPLDIEADDVVSATLRLQVALLTEERRDRRHGDEGSVGLGAGHRFDDVAGLDFSEETIEATGAWTALEADVTERIRAGGARQLRLRVETDDARNSWFHFDDVSLVACRPAPAAASASSSEEAAADAEAEAEAEAEARRPYPSRADTRTRLESAATEWTMGACCRSPRAPSSSLRSARTTFPGTGSGPSSTASLGGR